MKKISLKGHWNSRNNDVRNLSNFSHQLRACGQLAQTSRNPLVQLGVALGSHVQAISRPVPRWGGGNFEKALGFFMQGICLKKHFGPNFLTQGAKQPERPRFLIPFWSDHQWDDFQFDGQLAGSGGHWIQMGAWELSPALVNLFFDWWMGGNDREHIMTVIIVHFLQTQINIGLQTGGRGVKKNVKIGLRI